MYITRKHISRRRMLRGAGAALALPLLDAMIPAQTALAKTAAAPRPRLAFVYFPHGAVMNRWTPAAEGRAFDLPQILAPLKAHTSHLTVVSGLRNKAAESPAPHAITAGTWLGCVAPKGDRSDEKGTTADQFAAQKIGQDTPFPSLELATETGTVCDPAFGCGYGHTISFRTPGQPQPMEYNPRKVFFRLFGQGDTAADRARIVRETDSILDSISASAASLKLELGTSDRAMVDDYLESVREIERRVQKLTKQDASVLDVPDAPVGVPGDFGEHLGLMFDFMALAFQADLTRVATFMMAREVSMRSYPNLNVSDAFHPLSHHQNDPTKLDRLAKVQTYHTEMFAKFADKLAATKDGDGTLMDQSIVLYGSNMSNSDRHDHDPLPSAVLGHGCGRIKGGQHVRYPQDTPLSNLLLTLLDRAKIPVSSIGDSAGDLSEI
jgi:hypothetical protein